MNPYYAAGSIDLPGILAANNSPKYGELSVASAAGLSALENARLKLLAQTTGLEKITDAEIERMKRSNRGQGQYAESQTNAATKLAIANGIGGILGGIKAKSGGSPAAPMKVAPDWTDGDTTDVSYDDVLTMSGDPDYARNIAVNGNGMEWSSEWP